MIGKLAVLVGVLFIAPSCMAQAPAGAPAGATGLCNDGTYFTGAKKSGACRGHKGVKTWYGAPAAAAPKSSPKTTSRTTRGKPAPAPTPAPEASAPAPAPAPAPATSSASRPATTRSSEKTQVPGGGAGLVWVNTASNVYHCPGTQWYGKTKAGAYMSESDAQAKGARPGGGKPCK